MSVQAFLSVKGRNNVPDTTESRAKITRKCVLYDLLTTFNVNKALFFQFGQCFLHASHGLADIVIACGIAHTEAIGVAKSIASDSGHMGFLEQIEGEFGAVSNHGTVGGGHSVERRAFGEEVEGALWHVDL